MNVNSELILSLNSLGVGK